MNICHVFIPVQTYDFVRFSPDGWKQQPVNGFKCFRCGKWRSNSQFGYPTGAWSPRPIICVYCDKNERTFGHLSFDSWVVNRVQALDRVAALTSGFLGLHHLPEWCTNAFLKQNKVTDEELEQIKNSF